MEQDLEHYENGCRLIRQEDYEAALKEFELALQETPKPSANVFRNLGWCLYLIAQVEVIDGDYERAKEHLELAKEHYVAAKDKYISLRQFAETEKPIDPISLRKRLDDCDWRYNMIEKLLNVMQNELEAQISAPK